MKAIIAVEAVIIVGLGVGAALLQRGREEARASLAKAASSLSEARADRARKATELAKTNSDLSEAKAEIAKKASELAKATSELSEAKVAIARGASELEAAKSSLASANEQIAALNAANAQGAALNADLAKLNAELAKRSEEKSTTAEGARGAPVERAGAEPAMGALIQLSRANLRLLLPDLTSAEERTLVERSRAGALTATGLAGILGEKRAARLTDALPPQARAAAIRIVD